MCQRWQGRGFLERGDQQTTLMKRKEFKMTEHGELLFIFIFFFEQFRSQEILKSNFSQVRSGMFFILQ